MGTAEILLRAVVLIPQAGFSGSSCGGTAASSPAAAAARCSACDLGHHLRADLVEEVLGLVQQRCGGTVVEARRLVGRLRADHRAVRPPGVGPRLELRAVRRATPRRVGGEIEVALPHGLTVRVGAALELPAFLAHRHADILPVSTRRYAPRVTISVFELFRVGIGPSSSHTVGPMRAARQFAERLADDGDRATTSARASPPVRLARRHRCRPRHHRRGRARPHRAPSRRPSTPTTIPATIAEVASTGRLSLFGAARRSPFDIDDDVVLHPDTTLPGHPNGMQFEALDADRTRTGRATARTRSVAASWSTRPTSARRSTAIATPVPHPVPIRGRARRDVRRARSRRSARCSSPTSARLRPDVDVRSELLQIWHAMRDCVERGCRAEGELPGGLGVQRRAAALHRRLAAPTTVDPLAALDWVNLYALAVNEENAAGGRVVTAPTNGAAGIVPGRAALLRQLRARRRRRRRGGVPAHRRRRRRAVQDERHRISGAEVGCQGEVGSACAMAAAGLAEVMGGTPGRWRTPQRSRWNTTSASPATRSADSCRCRASSATRWRR